MKNQSGSSIKNLTLCALFAAIITVTIAYLPKLPLAVGYVHIADAFVFLAASILPLPYSVIACAIGGGLADVLCGYAIYAPASFVIKGVTALFFKSAFSRTSTQIGRIICLRNLLALLPSALVCFGGYFLYELLIYDFAAAAVGIPMNLLQSAVGAAIFAAIGLILDKTKLLLRLER